MKYRLVISVTVSLICLSMVYFSGPGLVGQDLDTADTVSPVWSYPFYPSHWPPNNAVFGPDQFKPPVGLQLAAYDFEVTYEGSALWERMEAVAYRDGLAYCGVGNGLEILDVSDPAAPRQISRLLLPLSSVSDVALDGDRAYVTTWSGGGLFIVDISIPTEPVLLGSLTLPDGSVRCLTVHDGYAYVSSFLDLVIVNVGDPSAPVIENSITCYYPPTGVVVWQGYLYVADVWCVGVFSLTDPANPELVAEIVTPGQCWDVAICKGVLVILDLTPTVMYIHFSAMQLVDISDPENPRLGARHGDIPGFDVVVVADSRFACMCGEQGVFIAEVIGPDNFGAISTYPAPGYCFDMDVDTPYLYVASRHVDPVDQPYTHLCDTCFCEGGTGSVVYSVDFQIVDVSDPATPCAVGRHAGTLYSQEVAVHQGCAYVVGHGPQPRLGIVDISLPDTLIEIGTIVLPEQPEQLCVAGERLYVVGSEGLLAIYDISNPIDPVLLSTLGLMRGGDIIARDDIVFVGTYYDTLLIVDATDPLHPEIVAQYHTGARVFGVALEENRAYLACYGLGLQVVDISDVSNPVVIGQYPPQNCAWDVDVCDGVAYVWDGDSLESVDISNPADPQRLGKAYIGDRWRPQVTLSCDRLMALLGTGSGLQFVDISEPSELSIIGYYDTPGSAHMCEVSGDYVMVADGWSVIRLGLPVSTDIEGPVFPDELPVQTKLRNVYPNPFNLGTNISVDLSSGGEISVKVYNILGQRIRTIYTGQCSAGHHDFAWDGCNDNGNTCPSGVYFASLATANGRSSKKMVLVK